MANVIFNNARGRIVHYAALSGTNDALIAVPLEAAGLPADATLVDSPSLSTLLNGASNEQTTMGRKTLTSVAVSVNNSTDTVTADADDITWTGAAGSNVGAIIICYVPDIGVTDDTVIIPLVKLDIAITPSGSNIVLQLNAEGFYKSA